MAAKVLHVRLFKADGKGNVDVVYPITKDIDVELSKEYTNLPKGANTLDDVLRALNPLAFGENLVTPESIGLGKLTNDRQVKGLSEGTKEDHVVVFGADGYSIKDSGHTIKSDVPENAVFTDTTYSHATDTTWGITQLSSDTTDQSDEKAATIGSVTRISKGISKMFASIGESKTNGCFSFNNEDIPIHGLGSAAYEDKTAFATAEQGELADKSIQKIKIGNVYEGDGVETADVHATDNNHVVTLDFTLPKGNRGSMWYSGTAVTGTMDGGVSFETGIRNAAVNDYYLNKHSGNYYHCIRSGDEHTALWRYEGCLKISSENTGGSGFDSLEISAIMMIGPNEDPRVENVGSSVAPKYVLYIPAAKNGKDGERGSYFFSGTSIIGTSTFATIFEDSGVNDAKKLDKYININTGAIYECVTPGSPEVAEWIYLFSFNETGPNLGTSGNILATSTEPEGDGTYFLVVD